MKVLLMIFLFFVSSKMAPADITECWKDYYARPVNSIHDAGNRNCGVNGYYAAGLCYGPCKPDEERRPTGWCRKPNGVVYISSTYQPKCNDTLEEQAGLCYEKCRNGFKGIGVLCWTRCQGRSDYPADCGMYCGPNGPYCDARNLQIIFTLGTTLGSIATNPTIDTTIETANSVTQQLLGRKVCEVQNFF